ncbi:hypothetical protein [Paenibacillus sp. 2KB_22]|uniref:hypothetical protein n=1 Tax=Paenibacillus sp. 2KB_22 TaxID=3232978 RepID=UPI003F9E4663
MIGMINPKYCETKAIKNSPDEIEIGLFFILFLAREANEELLLCKRDEWGKHLNKQQFTMYSCYIT